MAKTKWLTIAGLGLIGSIWALDAVAQGPGMGDHGRGGFDFSALDADGNGSVSIAEVKAAQQARFAEMDSNGDGVISGDEMAAAAADHAQDRAMERFSQMLAWRDSDGDGALSPSEFGSNRGEQMFMRADANHDGEITQEEMEQAKAHAGPRGGGHGRKGGHGALGGDGGHGG